jgi:tRNA threonylcarbamoyladenosine biosynthesis protein TsaB
MPSLKTLAIDTSTQRGSVALLTGDETLAEWRLASERTHSAGLLVSLKHLLKATALDLEDLDLVAACLGPGSFTGIRIGVATALGLAQALRIPFSGISGLDAIAFGHYTPSGRIGVVRDAQRRQVYYCEYEKKGRRMRRNSKPALWEPAALLARLDSHGLYLAGDTTALGWREGGGGRNWPKCLRSDLFLAASVGRLALKRKRHWSTGQALRAEPQYIRPPDALRSKRRRMP